MTAVDTIHLSESLEDYLEAIFQIVKRKQAARAKDIGERLQVGRSSVTGALRALADRQLVNYSPYDIVTLTPKGQALAEEITRRHEVLKDFFVKALSVDAAEAEVVACRMEHVISEPIMDRFVGFLEFVDRCPRGGMKWITGVGFSCRADRATLESCQKCLVAIQEETGGQSMTDITETPAQKTLGSLSPGRRAQIVRVAGTGGISRRLLDMGATGGTVVEVERVAPMGDPMEVKIRGYHLTLRKDEADRILVTEL